MLDHHEMATYSPIKVQIIPTSKLLTLRAATNFFHFFLFAVFFFSLCELGILNCKQNTQFVRAAQEGGEELYKLKDVSFELFSNYFVI